MIIADNSKKLCFKACEPNVVKGGQCSCHNQVNMRESSNDLYNVLGDVWQASDRPFKDYPIGTKAQAGGGEYWIKNERGWKWCTGSTFPRPGGDWNGKVCLPNCT